MVEVMLLNFEITSSSSSWKPSPARLLTAAWPSPIPEMRRNPDEVTRNEEANVETQCWKAPPLPSSAASLPSEPWPPPRLPRLLAAPGPQPPAWSSIIILFLLNFRRNTFVFLPPRRRGWSCSPSWSFPFPHEEASFRFPGLELKQWTKFPQQALLFKLCKFSYSLKFRLDLSYKKIRF